MNQRSEIRGQRSDVVRRILGISEREEFLFAELEQARRVIILMAIALGSVLAVLAAFVRVVFSR